MSIGTLLMLAACGRSAADGYLALQEALPKVGATAARGLNGAELFASVTFAEDEVPAVDFVALKRDRRCLVTYTVPARGFRGEPTWGHAPNSAYSCDDAPAADAALGAATQWARNATRAHYSEADLLGPALEGRARDASVKQGLIAQAEAWHVDFDLGACVTARTDRYASERLALASVRCAMYDHPARASAETNDALKAAALRARQRIAKGGVRKPVVPPSPLPEGCQAAAASVPLSVPGETTVDALGTPLAFAVQVFEGENLTVHVSAAGFDPVVLIATTDCNRVYAYNDDWRGRSSRAVWRATEDGYASVIVRSSGGAPFGTASLNVEVEGGNALSEQQHADLEAFAAWAEAPTEDIVSATWRSTASSELAGACLDAAVYGDAGLAAVAVEPVATADCLAYLETVIAARRDAAATQSLVGSLLSSVKGALK